MNIENLITTIEKMEADLCALKLKARQIRPALDALTALAVGFGPTTVFGAVEDVDDIKIGMQFISSVPVDTYNGYVIPAGVVITIDNKDRTNVPLRVTWPTAGDTTKDDWVQVRKTKLDPSKLTRIK